MESSKLFIEIVIKFNKINYLIGQLNFSHLIYEIKLGDNIRKSIRNMILCL